MRAMWAWLMALMSLLVAAQAAAVTVDVRLTNNRFTPNDLTINPGDTVRFINDQGFHDVRADDGSYGNTAGGPGWPLSRTYTAPRRIPRLLFAARIPWRRHQYQHERAHHGALGVLDRTGIEWHLGQRQHSRPGLPVRASRRPTASCSAPGSPSIPPRPGAAAFAQPAQRWLTLQGNYAGDTVNLQIFSTSGGVFNTPSSTTTTQVGTAALTFSSCTQGTLISP